jgi:ketosteroid isomerase-like protein
MSTAALSAAQHLATVQAVYGAFGRGDIPAVLEALSDDVRWEHWADSFAQRADVPGLRPRDGREGAGEFFALIAAWEISHFEVLDLMASDRQVTAEVAIEVTLPNGGRYRDEEIHLWGFDAGGKINRLRHYVDTAKHIAAAGGEDTNRRP